MYSLRHFILVAGLYFAILGHYFDCNAQGLCNDIYVTTSGVTTGTNVGSQSNPTTLTNAISIAQSGDAIKIATGTYTLNNSLYLKDSITLEGGFVSSSSWTKTSLPGATTITRTTSNPEGATNYRRLVTFYGNNISGFRLQDLTIRTNNGNQDGMSTYGVHLTSCSNYDIVRCQILPGNASAGASGTAGANGANGTAGDNGDENNDNVRNNGGRGGSSCGAAGGATATSAPRSVGATGNNGVSSSNSRIGGGGSGGGNEDRDGGRGGYGGGVSGIIGLNTLPGSVGGYKNTGNWWGDESGCNGSVTRTGAESGRPGRNGTNGANGANGTQGSNWSIVSGFFQNGGQGTTGSNGIGGQGGSGGGGGAGEGGIFCTDGTGAGGGGGGAGGCGGYGGTGGRGGGGSFALFLVNNGTNGVVSQSYLIAGNPGAGGTGGAGGTLGTGGNGGAGGTSGGDVGYGGIGGDGGDGGTGGDGGSGRSGTSSSVYLASGTALSTSQASFALNSQPTITASYNQCTNSNISYSASSSATWNFVYATPQYPTGANVTTQYDSIRRHDVVYGANT